MHRLTGDFAHAAQLRGLCVGVKQSLVGCEGHLDFRVARKIGAVAGDAKAIRGLLLGQKVILHPLLRHDAGGRLNDAFTLLPGFHAGSASHESSPVAMSKRSDDVG